MNRSPVAGQDVTAGGEGTHRTKTVVIDTRLPRERRTPRLRCTLAAEPVAAQVARHLVHACFTGRLRANVLDDACLVVTELVANAVAAIRDLGAPGAVEFGAWAAGGDVVVQVVDQAGGEPHKQTGGEYPGCAESGRGLLLVEALTRDWGWHPVPGGKAVWACVSTLGSGADLGIGIGIGIEECGRGLSRSPLPTVP